MTRKTEVIILRDMLLRVNTFTDHELMVQTLFQGILSCTECPVYVLLFCSLNGVVIYSYGSLSAMVQSKQRNITLPL